VPMVALAEAAVYAANNPGTPGHALAQSIVPRAFQKPTGRPMGELDVATQIEGPAARALSIARGPLPPADSADAATAGAAAPLPPEAAKPDRARIAALVREHHRGFVRGDTAMDYIVIVLDATDKFVWSTVGIGNVAVSVAGDTRTPAERDAFNREFAGEFGSWGDVRAGGGASTVQQLRSYVSPFKNNAPLIVLDGVPLPNAQLDTSRVFRNIEIESVQIVRGATAAAAYGSRAPGSGVRTGGGLGADTTLARSIGASAPAAAPPVASPTDTGRSIPGAYTVGWTAYRDGQLLPMNLARGLDTPGRGRSGVEGLPSTSVSSADPYVYAATELAPLPARVLVVHLTPGSTWKAR
jgi:hypothetical protein